jgi:hypothetical protein
MRVIRRNGSFGPRIEIVGRNAREPAPVVLARVLERPVGRGGGRRDPLPKRILRNGYVTVSVSRDLHRWLKRQADNRGLSLAAFTGMIVESITTMTADALDDLLAGEVPPTSAVREMK